MLFKILKLFGLDVPAKIDAVKASLELRLNQTTHHVKQVLSGLFPRSPPSRRR